MLVKAVYEFNFEPDTSDIDERFVDKKGISEEWAKEELKYMLNNGKITVEDFDFTVIDDGNDHSLTDDAIEASVKTIFGCKNCILYIDKPVLNVLEVLDKSWREEMKKWYKFGIQIWTNSEQKPNCITGKDKKTTFADLGISDKCTIYIVEVRRNVSGRQLRIDGDETYTEEEQEDEED